MFSTIVNLRRLVLVLILVSAAVALAQTPALDPREWKGLVAGPPTRVLNLGSPHLSQLSAPVNDGMLSALLDKLAAFKPDIVTVENVSGEQCEHLKRYSGVYPESFDLWCSAPDLAQKAMGMDTPAAAAEVRRTLSDWPAQPGPAARRRLAGLFLAAGETPSAVVQWRRLPADERHAGDGLNAQMIKLLERAGARPNESYDVGVALAVRAGLDRVFSVDDHTSDGILADADQAFEDALQAAWKSASNPASGQQNAEPAFLRTPSDVLALYRSANLPDVLRQSIKADMGAALSQQTPKLYGRQYVARWEARNLRMAANIRAAFATRPGARVLNIVGATHKPYYDAYLSLMHEVELVDVEAVLK